MVQRVILGTRSADIGLWVSKPGKLASSTVFEDLLIDTNRINTQPIFKGQIVNPTINRNDSYSAAVPGVSPNQIYNPASYWNETGVDGYYLNVMNHNLGYIPLCHISIGSQNAGDPYPQVFVTTTNLYLLYQKRVNAEYFWTSGSQFTKYGWVGKTSGSIESSAGSITFYCTINYTLFRQKAV